MTFEDFAFKYSEATTSDERIKVAKQFVQDPATKRSDILEALSIIRAAQDVLNILE